MSPHVQRAASGRGSRGGSSYDWGRGSSSRSNVAELDNVRATGTLQEFDITAFEQQRGVELNDDLYEGYRDEPVLVAVEIRPAQAERTTP